MPANRPRLLPLLVAPALLGLGCGSGSDVALRTPHGGSVVPFPEKRGSVEFVRKDAEGQPGQIQFVAYFYGPDNKLLAPPPTAATFTPAGRGAKPVEFKPSGDADGTLTSAPFQAEGEIEGELATTVDGKPIKLPIRVR